MIPYPMMDAISPAQASALIQRALERISDDFFFSGWCGGIEFDVWRWTQNSLITREMPGYEIPYLRNLSDRAGGWIEWDEQAGRARFVQMAEWVAKYDSWLEGRNFGSNDSGRVLGGADHDCSPVLGCDLREVIGEPIVNLLDVCMVTYGKAQANGTPAAAVILADVAEKLADIYECVLQKSNP